jgi:multidrug efflux pump
MSDKGKTVAEDKQAGTAKMEGEDTEGANPAPALTKGPPE